MVSKCFKCLNVNEQWNPALDVSMNLVISTSPIDSASLLRLSITLPHYSLSFFVNEREELESHDFKNMVYDENQCIGSLFGLENFLVLRQRTHIAGTLVPEALIPRRVIIPNGQFGKHADHQVRCDRPALSLNAQPLYHTYVMDTELNCLSGNGSLMSTEFLAYLHAITSCH